MPSRGAAVTSSLHPFFASRPQLQRLGFRGCGSSSHAGELDAGGAFGGVGRSVVPLSTASQARVRLGPLALARCIHTPTWSGPLAAVLRAYIHLSYPHALN